MIREVIFIEVTNKRRKMFRYTFGGMKVMEWRKKKWPNKLEKRRKKEWTKEREEY